MNGLEMPPRHAAWHRWTDLPMLLLAIGSLPLLLLEVVADRLSDSDQSFLTLVNVILFIAFAVDYVVGLAITNSRKNYVRTQWVNLLIVITQFLALLPAL